MRRCTPLFAALIACQGPETGPPSPPPPGPPALQLINDALSAPVFVTSPPGDPLRLFVVEQAGRVRVLRRDTLLATPFLDLQGRITSIGEQGLLSLAFHPRYATNGWFYVYFTDASGDTRVVRYTVSTTDSNVADPLSGDTLLAVDQPFSNHNGGLLLFGPDDKLYVGLGDGGGDADSNGQNTNTLLGKILRLDVDAGTPYAIPPDNPFVGVAGARGEIWAYGLRNPWRFSFDRQTGDLYIADVGQNDWEEVDVEPAGSPGGVNYGWNVMEGAHCYNAATCNQTALTLPVAEYAHADGCSITGGHVYRGTRVPALAGHYLYSDYCAHFVRSFRYVSGQAADHRDWTPQLDPGGTVSSFGEDARGELYVVTHGGRLYRIVEGATAR